MVLAMIAARLDTSEGKGLRIRNEVVVAVEPQPARL